MEQNLWVLLLFLSFFTLSYGFASQACKDLSVKLNVILLNDSESEWNLKKTKPFIEKALIVVEEDLQNHGFNISLEASYHGFDPLIYTNKGCAASTCEGVEILKSLFVSMLFFNKDGCFTAKCSCDYVLKIEQEHVIFCQLCY
ncbi:heat-stable enterotoxin receptor-like [Protopterus annectens]|uniref:heat-stable enterotoxin receptor-like n=1 Tax=Protopterus annectens TaxID=7888 RepID=UPI001CFA611B|nr:heat-stable enterotoxin receptor-like [Protopterus annectens]